MKRILLTILCALLLCSLAACASETGGGEASLRAQNAALKAQLANLTAQLNAAPAPAAESTEPIQPAAPAAPALPTDVVIGVNAKLNGGDTMLRFDGDATVVATAEVPEGMALDCWKLNGVAEELAEGDKPLPEKAFTVSGTTVIEAALRKEYKVTTINARMRFLNNKNKPKGDAFTEFVFEEPYMNPLTEMVFPGGTITVYVEAVVPKGYAIDYWKINEVPYYFNRTVSSFTVFGLDETTVYEVVLRKASAPASTPKPTAKPTAKPTSNPVIYVPMPTNAPAAPVFIPTPPVAPVSLPTEPPATSAPAPVEMCTVTCRYDCNFYGGDYGSSTMSGQVPKGTVITVSGPYRRIWTINGKEQNVIDPSGTYSGTYTFSYKVTGDVTFGAQPVN